MVGYVSTVDFSAWHIPCYSNHNCGRSRFAGSSSGSDSSNDPKAVMASTSLGAELVVSDSSAAAVSVFLLFLLLSSLLSGVAVAAALLTRKGFQRPMNVFILLVLTTDWLLIATAFPMQALRLTSTGVPPSACAAWMFLELSAVAARSWMTPAVTLAYYKHGGLVPTRRLVLVAATCWLLALLLATPPLVAADALVDLDTCSVRHISGGDFAAAALLIYSAAVVFVIPALILAPATAKWTGIKDQINVGEFEIPDDDESSEDEDGNFLSFEKNADQMRRNGSKNNFLSFESHASALRRDVSKDNSLPLQSDTDGIRRDGFKNDFLSFQHDAARSDFSTDNFLSLPVTSDEFSFRRGSKSPRPSILLGEAVPKLAINRMRDRDFPAVLFVFAITQAVFWTPFFVLFLLSPWLTSPPPAAFAVSATLLGYSQCAATPLLVLILADRVRRTVCYCKCRGNA